MSNITFLTLLLNLFIHAYKCSNTTESMALSTTSAPVSKPTYKTYAYANCTEANLDECGKVVFLYGNRGVHLPRNAKQMKPHCTEERSALKCTFDWGRQCLKSFPRQALFMMLAGATKNIKERCSKAGTANYLKNAKCVQKSADSQHTCMETLTSDLNSVRRNTKKKDWLPSVCCFIDKWKTCFNSGAKPFCDENGLKFLQWGADGYVSDLTDLACSAKLAWTGDRCQRLQSTIASSPPLNASDHVPKSVIVPMFRIVTSFADWDKRGPPRLHKFE